MRGGVIALLLLVGACGDDDKKAADGATDVAQETAGDTAGGTRLCQNENDGPKVAADAVFLPAYSDCVKGCSTSGPATASCVSTCLVDAISISAPCADCWGTYANCTTVACPACADPDSEACRTCNDGDAARACFQPMSDCTGFTF